MKKNGGASGIRGGLTTGLGELARGRVDPGLAFSLSFSFFLFFFFFGFLSFAQITPCARLSAPKLGSYTRSVVPAW